MPPRLHQFAQADTPEQVTVPSSWPGLATWAIGRFGIGIVGIYGLWIVYGDLKATNERMMRILESRAVTDAELARSMSGLTAAITKIADESRSAHSGTNQPR